MYHNYQKLSLRQAVYTVVFSSVNTRMYSIMMMMRTTGPTWRTRVTAHLHKHVYIDGHKHKHKSKSAAASTHVCAHSIVVAR